MGFFSDLKEDLSQAVNELIPEEEMETTKKEETMMMQETVWPEEEKTAPEKEMEMDFGTSYSQMIDNLEVEQEETVKVPEEPIYVAPVAEKVVSESKLSGTRKNIDETSILTESMIINGNMATEGSLEVRGSIVGNVEALGKLNITGVIQGNSQAAEIYAEGAKITGDLKSEGSIKVGQSTVIIGNIFAASAVIAGAIKGDIDVRGPVILDTSAIVMGDIKSKSVQINNGAVIEGMCSQCYAEVNPTSFFEELKKMK
ncbi:MAG: polymer-forming cytoskeletal protein [Lachnospiraceae bacterium]|nr:polymer-forming cytoskeletal protein [Lachnospiraceae bacterium]